MPAMLCVPVMVRDPASAVEDALSARDAGADVVELRIDPWYTGDSGQIEGVRRLVAGSPLPVIVTCRSAAEGGAFDGPDEALAELYEALGQGEDGPRYIDVEHAALVRSEVVRRAVEGLGEGGPGVVLSMHDTRGRPADLSRRVLAMRGEASARVLKVAFLARSPRDTLEVAELLGERDRPTIALAMGEFGLPSRVLASKLGGFLTFASLRDTSATAPGQPTVSELVDGYRFRSIGPGTLVYAVIGWPVGHSMSPAVHNAGFEAVGHDGVYLPLPVPAGEEGQAGYESLKATLPAWIEHPALGLRGASVTIPHKENLVRLAGEMGWVVESDAEAIGAANTLVVEADGQIRICNTDAEAVVAVLRDRLGERGGLEKLRVALIGAGGMARAAAWGLAEAGATVVVYNRTQERAESLAEALKGALGRASGNAKENMGKVVAMGLDALPKACADVVINTTPIGMAGGPAPEGTAAPLASMANLGAGAVVMDTVYNPVRTPLLAEAEARGLATVDGVQVFVRQAAAQFEAWTGRPAPVGLFDRVVRERLGVRG